MVAVDLIGPWQFRDRHGFEHSFIALTIIDVATNYVEIIRLDNKTAEHVSTQFENHWIARYPKPNAVIFDPGTEFKGAFREMLTRMGIQASPTTVKNPQANAVCERLHQSVGEVLRTLVYENPPNQGLEAKQVVDTALATAAYAARASIHSTMGVSPASIIFHRDMLLDVPLIADLQALKTRRQDMIRKNLVRANKARVKHHDYQPGQQVLKLIYNPHKLETRATGPYRIQKVHTNGNLTIETSPLTTERINIRRVRPYWPRTEGAIQLPANGAWI